jgi:hypothetical protein
MRFRDVVIGDFGVVAAEVELNANFLDYTFDVAIIL